MAAPQNPRPTRPPAPEPVPEENWDDDFEFQPTSPATHTSSIASTIAGNGHATHANEANDRKTTTRRNRHGNGDYRKLSTATEDWDVEEGSSTIGATQAQPPPGFPAGTKSILPSSANVAEPALGSTTTPHTTPGAPIPTENWDDDYEYARNSPRKPASAVFPTTNKPRAPGSPLGPSKSPREESWDDELELEEAQRGGMPLMPLALHRRQDGNDEDDGAEFGFKHAKAASSSDEDDDEEEDRTVTARSRRPPRAAPPPLPAFPVSILRPPSTLAHYPSTSSPTTASFPASSSAHSPQQQLPSSSSSSHTPSDAHTARPFPSPSLSYTHPSPAISYIQPPHPHAHPGPRSSLYSPSVFSLPGTVRSGHSGTTEHSTAPLRPSTGHGPPTTIGNRNYLQRSGFALLPPSPPIHKERERRRLRKKSRPRREGMIALVETGMGARVASFSAEDLGYPRNSFESVRSDEDIADGGEGEMDNPLTEPGVTSEDLRESELRRNASSSGRSVASSANNARRQTRRGQSAHQHQQAPAEVLSASVPALSASTSTNASSALGASTSTTRSGLNAAGLPLPPSQSMPVTPSKPRRLSTGAGVASDAARGLLNRIGSVKRWGAGVGRRRGASTGPVGADGVTTASEHSEPDQQRTPRPRSSLSSFHVQRGTPSSPTSSANAHWTNLFRTSASPKTRRSTVGATPGSTPRRSIDEERSGSAAAGRKQSRSRSRSGYVGHGNGHGGRGSVYPHALGGARASRASVNDSRTSLSSVQEGRWEGETSAREAERRRATMCTPSPDPAVPSGVRSGRRGSVQEGVGGGGEAQDSPGGRLGKRRSLGFAQLQLLRGGGGGNKDEEESRAGRYTGLGLGRAGAPQTPSKEDAKEGSRGFMGSMRRISLVGRHKRTKSGSGVALSTPAKDQPSASPSAAFPYFGRRSASREPVPPMPSTPSTPHTRRTSATPSATNAPPYNLPALANGSSSQVSLRMPSAHNHLPLPLIPRRLVSTSSSQGSSSILPASSSSSRNASGASASASDSQAPDTESQITDTKGTRKHSVSNATIIPSVARSSLDFDAQLRRSIDQEKENYKPALKPSHAANLLPPIELHPPSPPTTIGAAQASAVTSSFKSGAPDTAPTRSALNTSTSNNAGFGVQLGVSPTTSASSLFFTPSSSPQPPSSPAKLALPPTSTATQSPSQSFSLSPGKGPGSPGKSSSLGRAAASTTAIGITGLDGSSPSSIDKTNGGSGNTPSVQRRNSLGDLKIPARISQAQVSIKRDLGLVREFAGRVGELKALQDTYTTLLLEARTLATPFPLPLAPSVPPSTSGPTPIRPTVVPATVQIPPEAEAHELPPTQSTTFFAQLTGKGRAKGRPKGRARSNTNPQDGAPSSVASAAPLRELAPGETEQEQDLHRNKALLAAQLSELTHRYRITWECAELLIELGGGAPAAPTAPTPASASTLSPDVDTASSTTESAASPPPLPAGASELDGSLSRAHASTNTNLSAATGAATGRASAASGPSTLKKKSRERAITLAGAVYGPARPGGGALYPSASTARVGGAALPVPVSLAGPDAVVHVHDTNTPVDAGAGVGRAGKSLAGPPPASPPNMAWRASTGRHDLSQRQLVLLREMLGVAPPAGAVAASTTQPADNRMDFAVHEHGQETAPGGRVRVDRDWRWGDARNSTITLPSAEEEERTRRERRTLSPSGLGTGSAAEGDAEGGEGKKKPRMAGIRDMLRALTRSRTAATTTQPLSQPISPPPLPISPSTGSGRLRSSTNVGAPMQSTASLSTLSSGGQHHRYAHPRVPSARRMREHESTVRISREESVPATVPGVLFTGAGVKTGPRRPSLASIFRIGGGPSKSVGSQQSHQYQQPDGGVETGESSGTGDDDVTEESAEDADVEADGVASEDEAEEAEEDWDRMDSAADLDAAAAFARAQAQAQANMNTVRGGTPRRRLSKRKAPTKGKSPYLQPLDATDKQTRPPLPLPVPSSTSTSGGYSLRHHAQTLLQKRSFTAGANANSSSSQSSLSLSGHGHASTSNVHLQMGAGGRTIRLSNVAENVDQPHSPVFPVPAPPEVSASPQIGSVRSVKSRIRPALASPPLASIPRAPFTPTSATFNQAHLSPLSPSPSASALSPMQRASPAPSASPSMSTYLSTSGVDPALALAMTPENIKPLLENAKEVQTRLNECISEIRHLLQSAVHVNA